MQRLLIIASTGKPVEELRAGLDRSGFVCSLVSFNECTSGLIARQSPDLLMVEVDSRLPDSGAWQFIKRLKREHPLPVIVLVPGVLPDSNDFLEVDDFLTSPYDVKELELRVRRLLQKSQSAGSELIKCGNLVIDLIDCEVTVGGRVVELTFKEYELLKLLAANRGRVYTREDLLNKVWGYDYFGGDRTVDVHIRRLRSKIEGPDDTFIETVRNIGYRFKKDG